MGLRFSRDDEAGYTRERSGEGFVYRSPSGKVVRSAATIARLEALAVPPAYERVWYCADPCGHLQATGFDAKGRKQYRYHPEFREERENAKFGRMARFARALPKIRARVEGDLARRGMPKEKAIAVVVTLLDRAHLRIGNEQYARESGHLGLTTMRNRNVAADGAEVRFRFVGKSGIRHEVSVEDRRLARIVRTLREMPGQRLFQYEDDEGGLHAVTSDDVNAYLKEASGGPFTAKDFRTWAGTVAALMELSAVDPCPTTKREIAQCVNGCMKSVSARLGNTPAVCRKSYVHPAVVAAFESGSLKRADDPEAAVARLLRKRA